jgi:hypothetical protein
MRRNILPRTQFPLQEDTLSELVKKTGGLALGALIGKGGSKFGRLDIKRVYFGYAYFSLLSKNLTPCLSRNWLRDYSQVRDILVLTGSFPTDPRKRL